MIRQERRYMRKRGCWVGELAQATCPYRPYVGIEALCM